MYIDNISQYNTYMGCRTLHPLISVIDLSDATPVQPACLDMACYVIFLKEDTNDMACYGRKSYDYQDGMLTCFTPANFMNACNRNCIYRSKGYLLILHSDWIRYTSLGANLSNYTFLSYKREEALHLSLREKMLIVECIRHIDRELRHCIDRFSGELIAKYVGLLLDYCARFYERQFITRSDADKKVVQQTYRLITDYFNSSDHCSCKLPDAGYFAERLGMSSFYFGDLVKAETGKNITELVKCQRFEIAKKWLRTTDKPIIQIATQLRFCNVQYFTFLFKKLVGCSPQEYRQAC